MPTITLNDRPKIKNLLLHLSTYTFLILYALLCLLDPLVSSADGNVDTGTIIKHHKDHVLKVRRLGMTLLRHVSGISAVFEQSKKLHFAQSVK
ncbi:MAG: hypothetical protein ISR65_18840 [Bacteriovoracaceae bacterium]|nr:hypothetical protein [Bacteriovoracaceae bacterium]